MNSLNARLETDSEETAHPLPLHAKVGTPHLADLTERLNRLSEAATALTTSLTSDELKHRCDVLASGAKTAAALLIHMPAAIAARPSGQFDMDLTLRGAGSDGTETKLLQKIGCLAMELGLKADGLAVLQTVGSLLHGKPGGAVFRLESLLATGQLHEAAVIYNLEIASIDDPEGFCNALFAALWAQRGDTLWRDAALSAKHISTGQKTDTQAI